MNKEKINFILRPWAPVIAGIVFASGSGGTVKDIYGKEYVDASGGMFVNYLGIGYPEIVATIRKQAELTHFGLLEGVSLPTVELAAKLAEITPIRGKGRKVFFTVCGTETVDVSIRMARQYTGKNEIIGLKLGFHGWSSYGGLTLTALGNYRRGAGSLLPGIYHAISPYCYRCPLNLEYPQCQVQCAHDIENVIGTQTAGDVAAVIVEPILGGGGGIAPPDEWLPEVRKICDENNLLLIADEIQSGLGRTGKMFGVQHSGVEPDILLLSKAVGGGIPLGAIVTNDEVASRFFCPAPPTYSGNALSCAVGLKTIEIVERERLWENAKIIGEYWTKRFRELSEKFPIIGDVRFKGLMGGVELVKHPVSKKPAREEARKMLPKLFEEGVILFAGGSNGAVFRFGPPLNITKEEAEKVVVAFEKALGSL